MQAVVSGEALLEDAPDVLGIDADAVVCDIQLELIFLLAGVDADHAGVGRGVI